MNIDYKKDFLINALFWVIILGITVITLKYLPTFLLPFFVGIAISFFMQKPAEFLEKRFKIKKDIFAVILTIGFCALFFALLILILWAIGNKLMNEIKLMPQFFSAIENSVNDIKDKIFNNMHSLTIEQKSNIEGVFSKSLQSLVATASNFLTRITTEILKGMPTFLITGIVTVVASCYFAKDFDRLKKFSTGLLSVERTKKLTEIKNILYENTFKFFKGYLIIAAITFIELIVAFLILGLKKPILIAFIISIIDLLPVLGVGTILLPWSIIEFLTGDILFGIDILIIYIITAIVRNFIEPKIIGKQIGINPIFTLISMFLGLKIAGIGGMIICPLSLTVVIAYYKKEIDKDSTVEKKHSS